MIFCQFEAGSDGERGGKEIEGKRKNNNKGRGGKENERSRIGRGP